MSSPSFHCIFKNSFSLSLSLSPPNTAIFMWQAALNTDVYPLHFHFRSSSRLIHLVPLDGLQLHSDQQHWCVLTSLSFYYFTLTFCHLPFSLSLSLAINIHLSKDLVNSATLSCHLIVLDRHERTSSLLHDDGRLDCHPHKQRR